MSDSASRALVLRENGEWLRYVLWGCAVGMGWLLAGAITSVRRDPWMIYAGVTGMLLFAFSGFVIRTRRVVIDPVRREVTIASRRIGQAATQRIAFASIERIVVLPTLENVENLRGVDTLRTRWLLALSVDGRNVTITGNPYLTREAAMRDAMRIRQVLSVAVDAVPAGTPLRPDSLPPRAVPDDR